MPSPRAQTETRLWQEWHESGRSPQKLRPLLKSLQPLVNTTMRRYGAADVSKEALRQEIENQLIRGLNTYDPRRASLSTHLNWHMRSVGRFVERHQNLARIPGNRIRFVGRLEQAQANLRESLGRAPTLSELSQTIGLREKDLEKLQRELRKVKITGLNVDADGRPYDGPGGYVLNPELERIKLVYNDLTDAEKMVVDYALGRKGPPLKSTKAIARRMGVSESRVSNLRASIARKAGALSWLR